MDIHIQPRGLFEDFLVWGWDCGGGGRGGGDGDVEFGGVIFCAEGLDGGEDLGLGEGGGEGLGG